MANHVVGTPKNEPANNKDYRPDVSSFGTEITFEDITGLFGKTYNCIASGETPNGTTISMGITSIGACQVRVRLEVRDDATVVDIIYGGTGNDPLKNSDHGCIVMSKMPSSEEWMTIEWNRPGTQNCQVDHNI